jgi:ubiquinone/menaquinone biosynthesis C-methylase UbiE
VIRDTISRDAARRFYDRLGARHDWAEGYEGRAKARAMDLLDLRVGQAVLNVGVGTGKEHARLVSEVGPSGLAVGMDISLVMLGLTRTRTGAQVCLADARSVPITSSSVDRLFCAYVLDLLPAADLPGVLSEFGRVLAPGGRLALVTLTDGVDLASRLFVAAWKLVYSISPITCGGCRPLSLDGLVRDAGLTILVREVVVQLGVPSEVIVAAR